MNERIKELAEQANGFFHPRYLRWGGREGSVEFQEENLEKFAELIVRECIRCLQPLSRNHSMVGAAQDTIREHFNLE